MNVQPDPYSVPLESIDMSDPDLHHQGLEHIYFERLRKEAPLHHFDSADYGPFWSLSRYEDIIAVDKNHRDWSSDHSNGGHVLGTGRHPHQAGTTAQRSFYRHCRRTGHAIVTADYQNIAIQAFVRMGRAIR